MPTRSLQLLKIGPLMIKLFQSLWHDRELVLELSKRELFQGHTSHIFGGLWVFINPLLTLGVYFLVFRYIFQMRAPGSGASEVFLISGLVQWVVLSELLVKSCSLLRGHANLVKQINFPMESLVGKLVLSMLFVQIVMTAGLVVIMAGTQSLSPSAVGLWLIAFFLQSIFMLGIGLLLSALTPFVPDVSELVGVVARLGLFVTPILYKDDQFGPVVANLFHWNPLSYFAWIHQHALFDQAFVDPVAWIGAAAIAFSTLWIGNYIFKLLGPAFSDVL